METAFFGSQMASALQRAVEKTRIKPKDNLVPKVALELVGSATPNPSLKLSRRERRTMAVNSNDDGQRDVEQRRQRNEANRQTHTIRVTINGITVEVPTGDHAEESNREWLQDFVNSQIKVSTANSWASVFGQFASGALAVVGAVAMTWAVIQGVRSTTRSN